MRAACARTSSSRPRTPAAADPEFLYLVLGEAIKAGATTLNIPDTVGYTTPDEFGALIAGIIRNTPGIEKLHRLGALPQRPGAGHGQHAGGHPRGRAPGRSHDQRHRRAGRQHLARRSGDGAAHPPPSLQPGHRHRHDPDHARQQAGEQLHRHRRPAQQGHRRRERLCARGRHPPGRHAQAPADLRDHAAGDGRRDADPAGAGQALRAARVQVAPRASWAMP